MEYSRTQDKNMGLERAQNFIKSVGFPIVAFLMMWYLCNNTIRENTAALHDLAARIDGWATHQQFRRGE